MFEPKGLCLLWSACLVVGIPALLWTLPWQAEPPWMVLSPVALMLGNVLFWAWKWRAEVRGSRDPR